MTENTNNTNGGNLIEITFLSPRGSGLAKRVGVEPGTTLREFLEDHDCLGENSEIRLVRGTTAQTPLGTEVLQGGDVVSVVLRDMKGA